MNNLVDNFYPTNIMPTIIILIAEDLSYRLNILIVKEWRSVLGIRVNGLARDESP